MSDSRTDLLIRATRKALEKYRHDLDVDRDLRSITVIVKMSGPSLVRAVIVSRESTAEEVNGNGGASS